LRFSIPTSDLRPQVESLSLLTLELPQGKKKLPERSCPRGAKDNNLIRERLDGVASVLRDSRSVYAKRATNIHVGRVRSVVRRNQTTIAAASPQMQTLPRGPFCFLQVAGPRTFVAVAHSRRVWAEEY
jgi:hypothetical protein